MSMWLPLFLMCNLSLAIQGPRAVLGPGTGLGEAQLIWDDRFEGYKVYASEGSHSTFAPRGDLQRQLQAFVEQKFGYCEGEPCSR